MAAPEQLDLFLDTTPAREEAPAAPPKTAAAKTRDKMRKQAEALRIYLQKHSGTPVSLIITDNTRAMMSLRRLDGGRRAEVRLHHMFLTAPPEVRLALSDWILRPNMARLASLFRDFIASRSQDIRPKRHARETRTALGTHYNLKAIFDEINQQYFDNRIDAAICWGRDSGRKVRSMHFGTYYCESRLIRIHPRLDQAFVPPVVVRYIVFHEMLHAHLGVSKGEDGRRIIHSRQFKKQEKTFTEYEQAVAWIKNKENLNRMLRPIKR